MSAESSPAASAGRAAGAADEERDRALIRGVLQQVQAAEHAAGPALEQLGEFRILDLLGEGGMGVVYRAEQQHPRREVALKVMRPDRLTPSAEARFRREADALGRLQHPGIAQVLEAGIAETSIGPRPYFAMELVRGEPLTAWAESRELATRERLELLARVCDAVQHAHEHHVVHRDLKPGNIVVDGTGQPKVLDFGVARATDNDTLSGTRHTDVGQMIGTLLYMSPEQVQGDPRDVDARSDVYALGVVAFELLVGRLPYQVRRKSVPEAARIIREEEPAALSRFDRSLRGDVELIVGRCLAKERERRYPSAAALAEDIRRYLRGERPSARHPTAWYQLRRFARRHKVLAGAVGAVLLTVTTGLAVSLRMYVLAELRLAELTRLADLEAVRALREEVRRVAAEPGNVPRLRDWLRRAALLVGRIDLHRATLAALRSRARRLPADDAADGRRSEALARLDDMRRMRDGRAGEVAAIRAGAGNERSLAAAMSELARVDGEIRDLEATLAAAHRWKLDDPAEDWQHQVLMRLVGELEAFGREEAVFGTIGWGRRQLTFAEYVRRESVEDRKGEWRQAITSIASRAECPAYAGLVLMPQVGLAPVGRDPASGLWEFAYIQTGRIPGRGADGVLELDEETALVLVLLPGGTFDMGAVPPGPGRPAGAANVDALASAAEGPVNAVTLDPFFISKYELTQGQWMRFSGENPSTYAPPHAADGERIDLRHPVETVSWAAAEETLARLGLLLPTAAQSEYAGRGGTPTAWWTGSEERSLAGAENIVDATYGCGRAVGEEWAEWLDDGYRGHAPAGCYRANGFGLHDVLGNVAEWCYDGAGDYTIPARMGDGLRVGVMLRSGMRVIRGGSFQDRASRARSAFHGEGEPGMRAGWLGVRPVRPVR